MHVVQIPLHYLDLLQHMCNEISHPRQLLQWARNLKINYLLFMLLIISR